MSYRPYPNVDRALAQVRRHEPAESVIATPECLRPMVESFDRLREEAFDRALDGPMWQAGLRIASPPLDEYRLSTRPRVVGGLS